VALHDVAESDDRRAQGLGPELLHFGHPSRLLNPVSQWESLLCQRRQLRFHSEGRRIDLSFELLESVNERSK
jgi:hypothetical protein